MTDYLKRILVPLDPSVFSEAATDTACAVAARHGARVGGIAVLDSAEIRSSLVPAIGPYYPMMLEAVQTQIQHADSVLKECLDRFASSCEKHEVTHIETEYEGVPAQKLLETSIFFDLIVIGLETAFHFETRAGKGDTLDKLLDRTVVPVLAVPSSGLPRLDRAVLAFDGSLGSARAMHDFVPFALASQPEVTILVAGKDERENRFLADNARDFLASHGLESVDTFTTEKRVEDAIAEPPCAGADLVVAGIHSRKPIQDYFVGSFTRTMIERKDTALFLSH